VPARGAIVGQFLRAATAAPGFVVPGMAVVSSFTAFPTSGQ
jgi:hypothetical protein